jgi:septum formation protein
LVIQPETLILASASEGRRRLLEQAGYRFEVRVSDVDEAALDYGENPDAEKVASVAARAKTLDVAAQMDCGVILGADSVADHNGRLLGKPTDRDDAHRMLTSLAGTRHRIVTAMVAVDGATGRKIERIVSTDVYMHPMTAEQIQAYVDSGRSDGKCGAYAIQESGDRFAQIEGSVNNVVGLPVENLDELFAALGDEGVV